MTYSKGVKTTNRVFDMNYRLSISDDDVCSDCAHCTYLPGDLSNCDEGWPADFNDDGYAVSCVSFFPRIEGSPK